MKPASTPRQRTHDVDAWIRAISRILRRRTDGDGWYGTIHVEVYDGQVKRVRVDRAIVDPEIVDPDRLARDDAGPVG